MLRHLFDRLGWGAAGAATVTLVMVLAGAISAGPLDPGAPPSSPSGVFGSGTPISSLPYTINSSGSYYLTGDLTGVNGADGITIAAHDVSLDLRGFTLKGVVGAGDGVRVQSPTHWRAIHIRNGTVRGWPGSGVQAQISEGGVFDSLVFEGNGLWGIVVGPGGVLSRCSATGNGQSGINANEAVVSGCVSRDNGGNGFQISFTRLTDCVATYNTFAGIDASSSHIEGCSVQQNDTIGIKVSTSDVKGNRVYYNGGTGIEVSSSGSTIENNTVHRNGMTVAVAGYGIDVPGNLSRIADNHVTDVKAVPMQDMGIRVTGDGNIVIRNTAFGHVTNYSLAGVGDYGPLTTAAAATDPFSNIDD